MRPRLPAPPGHGNPFSGGRLASPAARVTAQRKDRYLFVLGVPLRFGIGYALPETETVPYAPQGRACYWGGWGGSVIMMDLDAGTTVSYM